MLQEFHTKKIALLKSLKYANSCLNDIYNKSTKYIQPKMKTHIPIIYSKKSSQLLDYKMESVETL